MSLEYTPINELLGKTFTEVTGCEGGDELIFTAADGSRTTPGMPAGCSCGSYPWCPCGGWQKQPLQPFYPQNAGAAAAGPTQGLHLPARLREDLPALRLWPARWRYDNDDNHEDILMPELNTAALDQVEADIKATQQRLDELKAERHRILTEPWGIAVGSIVRETGTRRTKPLEGEVVNIDHMSFGRPSKPWVSIRFRKKDGSWSEALRNLYSQWEKI